jgi:amino acid adenylation domain-containing protein
VALGAYAHQDLPFELLVQELQPTRDLSRNPLFQVLFIFNNVPMSDLELPGLTISYYEALKNRSAMDLSLSMEETTQGLTAFLEYSTILFDAAKIERMLTNFQNLLESITAFPTQSIAELPLLSETERHKLLVEWNDTKDYSQNKYVYQLFEAQAEQNPDAIAISFEGEQITYEQLNAESNKLAHGLISLGVEPNRPIAILLNNGLQQIVSLLAVLKIGCPIVCLDINYPQDRLKQILEEVQPPYLISESSQLDNYSTLLEQCQQQFKCKTIWMDIPEVQKEQTPYLHKSYGSNCFSNCSTTNPHMPVAPTDTVYIVYTSGSTGKPKGIMQSHQSFCQFINWLGKQFHIQESKCVAQWASITYDAAYCEIFGALCFGATLCMTSASTKYDSSALVKWARKEQISLLQVVPSFCKQIMQALKDESASGNNHSFSHLEFMLLAGEVMHVSLAHAWLNRFPNYPQLFNLYGPTESILATYYAVEKVEPSQRFIPIGRSIDGRQILILDKNQQLCPIGVIGEIYIRSQYLTIGYFQRPEETQKVFIQNPLHNEYPDPVYRTGDLGRYLPDANIELYGRIDNQVKIRGSRVELEDIESALSHHPLIRDQVVIAQSNEEDDQRLIAYLVLNQEQVLTVSELRHFLRNKLPEYMMPAVIVFLNALPLTPNGKVDRRRLPMPDWTDPNLEQAFVAPRTLVEEVVANIWSEVLSVSQVGIHDNFFELGGHSLVATQVISRVRDALRVEIPLRTFFEAPTVAGLVKSIETTSWTEQASQVPPLQPILRSNNLPLSFAQQRLWFVDQLESGSPFYNVPAAIHCQGLLNVTVLEQSLNEILRRHEALRVFFTTVSGAPVQVVSPNLTLTLPIIDLQEISGVKQQIVVKQLAIDEAQQPFDLTQGPLLRAKLLKLDREEYIFLVTMHHIVCDGWSFNVFVQELTTLYSAFSTGKPSPLPNLEIQCVDFAYWQRQWLQGEVLEAQVSYWKEKFAGSFPTLELPTDRPRPPMQTFHGARRSIVLPKVLTEALKALSRQEESTLFMTLLAAFKTLLYRYTGQTEIVVGTPIANRRWIELEKLIGFFANTLVLRTDFASNFSFRELLVQVREVTLEAYAHQDLPFEKLVEELQPQRDLSRTPLFQVMFVLQNTSIPTLEIPGLTLNPLDFDSRTAKFDLTLVMGETDEGMIGSLEYNSDLFYGTTIDRMLGHFQTLLEGIIASPEQRLSNLPILSEAERLTLLLEWNDTQADYSKDVCIHDLFAARVKQTPDAVAVVYEDKHLTYSELNAQANQVAHYLRALGVSPEVLVGIYVERSLEMLVGILGIFKAGGAYVPLDPVYPKERLAFMLADAQVPVLLTQQHLVEELPQHQAQVVCLDADCDKIHCVAKEYSSIHENEDNPTSGTTTENLAYVIYTSGSTGQPKGVLISHGNVIRLLEATKSWFHFNTSDVWTMFHSYAFDFSVWELWGALLYGERLVVVPYWVSRSPETFYNLICTEQVTVLNQTPSAFRQLIQAEASLGKTQYLALRLVIFGGEVLELQSLSSWFEHHGDQFPQLVNMYGITETAVHVSYHPVTVEDLNLKEGSIIGRPIPDLQIYILDHYQQPMPIGVPGEMYIGGAGLARGYLNRPDLTIEKFIPNSFNKRSSRLYRSGDLARYLPDGNIEYIGRIDHQVKIRGFRIELGEIEAALNQHPSVQETIVLAREDHIGDKRLAAYIVPHQGQAPITSELRNFLKKKLPNYMIPSSFTILDALPLTPNGKVDRQSLPVPDKDRAGLEQAYVGPRDALELQLVQIWEDLLGIRSIGVMDNFFDLGGHSILAVNLMAQIQQRFNQTLPLATLFQGATIESLASILRQQHILQLQSPLVQIQPGGSKQPFFCVHPSGGNVLCYVELASYLDLEQPFYGLQAPGLDGEQEPYTRVEDMANHYIEAIRTVQPQGPYLLGGWSMGGVVAFEMAQQLQKQGHQVALLALLDSKVPNLRSEADLDRAAPLIEFAERLGLTISISDFESLEQNEQLNYILEQAKKSNIMPSDAQLQQLTALLNVCNANVQALYNYVPQVYSNSINLLRTNDHSTTDLSDSTLGWSKLSSKSVEIYIVPGDHNSMLTKPHVPILAKQLSTCLNQAQTIDLTVNQDG